MDTGFPILMLIFSGALLLYAALLAITKDYKMLPYKAQIPVRPKNPKKYTMQISKIVAIVALAIAAGAAVAFWNMLVGAIVMLTGVVLALWAGTKIIKKAN